MITEGKITIELLNQGSKSEGRYAVMNDTEGKAWILYRSGVYPAGDEFFTPFDGHQVSVEGEKEIDQYIRVDSITIKDEIKEETENE